MVDQISEKQVLTKKLEGLPPAARESVARFAEIATAVAGETLRSIILFGSGAQGRLRATSDVNLICLLENVDPRIIDRLRVCLQEGHTSVRLRVMFMKKNELDQAASLFAVKFADIKRRHLILYGENPFAQLTIDRNALKLRLKQILMNLILRSRATFAYQADNERQITIAIADMAGPLRSTAATIAGLEGKDLEPKRALIEIARESGIGEETMQRLSDAREGLHLDLETCRKTHLALQDLCEKLLSRASSL